MAPYNPPPESQYSHIRLNDIEAHSIYKIMGKNGNVFKTITEKAKASYIWYNKNLQIIEIWGPFHSMKPAQSMLNKRIDFLFQ